MCKIVSLKVKKIITITNKLQKLLEKSSSEPNKIMTLKVIEFCKRTAKSWLEDNDIKICSAHYVQLINKNLNIMLQSKKRLLMLIEILSLKTVIISEYENIKIFSEKIIAQIGLNIFL